MALGASENNCSGVASPPSSTGLPAFDELTEDSREVLPASGA